MIRIFFAIEKLRVPYTIFIQKKKMRTINSTFKLFLMKKPVRDDHCTKNQHGFGKDLKDFGVSGYMLAKEINLKKRQRSCSRKERNIKKILREGKNEKI